MLKLYTAVRRYEANIKSEGKVSTVIANEKEAVLQKEEMILWSCLMWNIVTKEEARSVFLKKSLEYGVDLEIFDAVLERLQGRHLVVSVEADRGNKALYGEAFDTFKYAEKNKKINFNLSNEKHLQQG